MPLLGKKLNEISPEDLELIKEAAGALARYGQKLEKALSHLRATEEILDDIFISSPREGSLQNESLPSLEEAIQQYQEAHLQAEQARYKYIVQREAVGFRNHKFADQLFPLPGKKRNLSR